MATFAAAAIRLDVQIDGARNALSIGPSGWKLLQQVQRSRVSMALAGLAFIDAAAAALHTNQKQYLQ